jgi:type IV pilus assembly protein PilE
MPKRIASRTPDCAGFSLIELMVTVVIAATLISVAIPAYNSQIRKSRRTEAKTALVDLAAREERFYNMSSPPAYSAKPSDLGYTVAGDALPMTVGNGYYQVNITLVAAAPPQPQGYSIAAVPITADQLKDAQCQNFTLTSTGQQTSTPNTTACWQ